MKLQSSFNIYNIYAQQLMNEHNSKEGSKSNKFSPSNLGRCYRLQMYKKIGTKPDVIDIKKAYKKVNPELGTATHNAYEQKLSIDNLTKYKPDLWENVESIEEEFITNMFKGRVDIKVADRCIDIKSTTSDYFRRIDKEKDPFNKFFTNWLQVCLYSVHFKKEYCQLSYIERNYGRSVDFSYKAIDIMPYLEKELIELKKCLEAYDKDKVLPEAKARAFNGKDCDYCDFQNTCKGETNGDS